MLTLRKFIAVFITCFTMFGAAHAQVVLSQLDPAVLDTSSQSLNGDTQAFINFVNNESFAVNIYWIDYSGDRVFYNELNANTSYLQQTFLTHPWIAVKAGSGDTLDQGTGQLLTGFLAVTPNPGGDQSLADIAYIGAVPEPATYALLLTGVLLTGLAVKRQRRI